MEAILTTNQLLDLIYKTKGIIEAALLLNFGGKATHFISTNQALIFDEGIDDELVKWQPSEFIAHYKNSVWVIDQIIYEYLNDDT